MQSFLIFVVIATLVILGACAELFWNPPHD